MRRSLLLIAIAVALLVLTAVPGIAEPGDGEERAVIWDRHGVVTDLGTLGLSSWGDQINDRNQVIGYFAVPDPGPFDGTVNRTFFWTKGQWSSSAHFPTVSGHNREP